MQDRAQRIELPDGTEVWARVSRLDAPGLDGPDDTDGTDGEFEDVGAWDALGARVEGLREVIGGVAASVRQGDRAGRAARDERDLRRGAVGQAGQGRRPARGRRGQGQPLRHAHLAARGRGAVTGGGRTGDPRPTAGSRTMRAADDDLRGPVRRPR